MMKHKPSSTVKAFLYFSSSSQVQPNLHQHGCALQHEEARAVGAQPCNVLQAPSLQAPLPPRPSQRCLLQGAAAPGSQAGPQELHGRALGRGSCPLATGPPQSPGSQELAGGLEGGGVCWESGASSQLQHDGICGEPSARGRPDRGQQPGRASASPWHGKVAPDFLGKAEHGWLGREGRASPLGVSLLSSMAPCTSACPWQLL